MILTLTQLCYQKVAQLMKDSYWSRSRPLQQDSPSILPELLSYNPFTCLPTTIVDKLIIYFSRISELQGSDWELLLTSGRVRNLSIAANTRDFNSPSLPKYIGPENLSNTLLCLSFSSLNLTAIKIDEFGQSEQGVTKALDLLISNSPNLRHLESNAEFHFRNLINCCQLEELVVNFITDDDNPISDFFNVNGQFRHHHSLKRFVLRASLACTSRSFFQQIMSKNAIIHISSLLANCLELTSIDCDISQSLEYSHLHELQNGSLTRKYKLQRCFLKNFGPVSRNAIQIASVTCPDLKEVFVWTNEEGISSLSTFNNLRHLEIHFTQTQKKYKIPRNFMAYLEESRVGAEVLGDYGTTVKPLLKEPEFGFKLVNLHLWGFTNIDFSSIGNCCPNLEDLVVFYEKESNASQVSPTSFRKLHRLKLTNEFEDVEEDTLVTILSRAVDLEELHVHLAGKFTDAILNDILKVNSFSKLKDIFICKCRLSSSGIANIASTVKSLKTFTFFENIITKSVTLKKFNSNITVETDNEFVIEVIKKAFENLII